MSCYLGHHYRGTASAYSRVNSCSENPNIMPCGTRPRYRAAQYSPDHHSDRDRERSLSPTRERSNYREASRSLDFGRSYSRSHNRSVSTSRSRYRSRSRNHDRYATRSPPCFRGRSRSRSPARGVASESARSRGGGESYHSGSPMGRRSGFQRVSAFRVASSPLPHAPGGVGVGRLSGGFGRRMDAVLGGGKETPTSAGVLVGVEGRVEGKDYEEDQTAVDYLRSKGINDEEMGRAMEVYRTGYLDGVAGRPSLVPISGMSGGGGVGGGPSGKALRRKKARTTKMKRLEKELKAEREKRAGGVVVAKGRGGGE